MKYLDHLDDLAQSIGAVNTVVNDDGKLLGYNTDAYGAFEALKNAGIDVSRNKTKVLILGAGGAASAVAVPLAKAGNKITIANRTFETGERLAEELNKFSQTTAIGLDDIPNMISDVKILINCTPVGMKGYLEDSPIPANLLRDDLIVFDIVYSPMDTPLLTAAKKIGAKIIYGYEMLILQGVKAFELWTGITAPIELMRRVVLEELEPNIGGQ
jgi:shikimate dehydrogenase